MKITVRTKPNARKNKVVRINERSYAVSVTAPAVDGKANDMLISVLSEFFKKPRRFISIMHGVNSRTKIINIE